MASIATSRASNSVIQAVLDCAARYKFMYVCMYAILVNLRQLASVVFGRIVL